MAPRRKRATTTKEARDFKIRLPEDIRDRVEAKAETTGWPMNRVIINELADYPRLEKFGELADQIGHLGNLLARYGAKIRMVGFVGAIACGARCRIECGRHRPTGRAR